MPEERTRRPNQSLGAAATALILLLGGVASVLGWLIMRRQLEVEIVRQTALHASTLADVVEVYVDDLYGALRRRAEQSSVPRQQPDSWSESIELLLAENPALLAIAHSDPSRPMLGSDENIAILKHLMPSIADGGDEAPEGSFLVGPLRLADGRPVFGLRVRTDLVQPHATVFAAFDPDVALHALMDRMALGYGIRIAVGDEEIYRREPPDAKMLFDLGRADFVALGLGTSWSLSVSPTSTVAASFYDEGPLMALGAGLAATVLIGLAVHFSTLAWRRAEALRVSNAELEQQVQETRRGKGELEQLSAELEARVAERTLELNETIADLETFNYSVSHDLRGPLGAVINFASILREDHEEHLDAAGRENLSRIVHSAASAVSMMDALLAYARSGRADLHKTPLDVTRLVRHVLYDEGLVVTPESSCVVKIGDLPDVVADESMLRFIFMNLISNACKFTRTGEAPCVEVGGSVAGNEATYYVRDEGVGFDMRFSDKLFKVFERLHGADEFDGHGVGLAVVARMVRRHGGHVWAQAAVGKGATFYFTVPVREGGGDGRSTI
jgi:signal transduction histidine kinase